MISKHLLPCHHSWWWRRPHLTMLLSFSRLIRQMGFFKMIILKISFSDSNYCVYLIWNKLLYIYISYWIIYSVFYVNKPPKIVVQNGRFIQFISSARRYLTYFRIIWSQTFLKNWKFIFSRNYTKGYNKKKMYYHKLVIDHYLCDFLPRMWYGIIHFSYSSKRPWLANDQTTSSQLNKRVRQIK